MLIKNEIYLISFISLINTAFSYNSSFKWDEETLFEYIKQNYLTPDNATNNINDFNYLIIDPNEFLKESDLFEIKNNLDKLYKKYNISSFIYIINYLKKNTELSYNLKNFNNKIFSEIHKYKKYFDEYSTISLLFQVENEKMNIRLGSTCRNIISDSEAFQILKDNSQYLTNKQINILLNKIISSLIKKYSFNYNQYIKSGKNIFSIIRKIFTFKGILFLSIIIFCYFMLMYFCLIFKFENKKNKKNAANILNNIEQFIINNKEDNLEQIMKTFCIICLNKYEFNEIIESENNNKDKLKLPCGHMYHNHCLYKYFKLNKNKNCPICKAKFKINSDDLSEKINIKNFNLNNNFDYNENNNSFDCYIKDFIELQKCMNSFEVNNDFCEKMIDLYYNQNLENSSVKIKNY